MKTITEAKVENVPRFFPSMNCPFCLNTEFRPSWLMVSYKNRDYNYLECQHCRSLVCDPMPDSAALLDMYSVEYCDELPGPERFKTVIDKLSGREKGVFVDYGCGDGSLLKMVFELGWKAIGVEFNPETVKALSAKYQFPVLLPDDPTDQADVLHLGDVIEHLTDLNTQLPAILERLKSGGILIAQNPLEANQNLFLSALKLFSRFRRGSVQAPPYHVTHATTKGQRELFRRLGLETVSLEVDEICFPAPDRLSEAKGMRQILLYLVRRVSQGVSSLLGVTEHGNRYTFVGQKKLVGDTAHFQTKAQAAGRCV